MRQRLRQHAGRRRAAGRRARPHLPDVVLILGDVGQMREIAEGAHDAQGLADRHAVEDQLELAPRRLVVVAVEPDRGLPDAFDQVEHVGALLVAHGVAENAPEQPDIGPQPGILGVFDAIGADFGLGRHGLGRHGWLLQRLARQVPECASFLPQCKIKMAAS